MCQLGVDTRRAATAGKAQRLPKTYQFWSGVNDVLVDLPTKDGKKIEVTSVRGEMRDVITSHDLAEVVRSTDRELTYTFQVELPVAEASMAPGDHAQEPPATGVQAPIVQPGARDKIEIGRETIVQQIKDQPHDRRSAEN